MMRHWMIAAALALCACSPNGTAPTASVQAARAPARIDETALLRVHPFAPLVAQLDADLQTLQAALRDDAGGSVAQLAHASQRVRAQLARASTQIGNVPSILPDGPHASGAPGIPALAAQLAGYRAALQARMQRAIVLRKAQLNERELTVAYQFDRAHAGQRLQIRLRLHTLHLDPAQRAALESQLHALDAQDRASVAKQVAIDRAQLAAYRTVLAAETAARIAGLQRSATAQMEAMRAMHASSATALAQARRLPGRADTRGIAAAFAQADADLTARFAQLRVKHEQASRAAIGEVALLQAERRRLLAEMRAQIDAQAQSIAQHRGLGRVYTGAAPAGATDLTGAVEEALRAIRG